LARRDLFGYKIDSETKYLEINSLGTDINFGTDINKKKNIAKFASDKPELLPGLTLAYIGDGYYELVVRNHLLSEGARKVEELHKQAISLVRAGMQARLAHRLEPELSEFELTVFHRGRNAKGQHIPKGATVSDYRAATGMEALVGYWYLAGAEERLERCFEVLWQIREEEQRG
jgi:ribonuclease-3 family protein